MTERQRRRRAFAALLSASAALAYVGFTTMDATVALETHTAIVENEAPARDAYRVLVPFVVEGAARIVEAAGATRAKAIPPLYAVANFVALTLFFFAMYRFLTRLHPHGRSLAGSLLVAALLPIGLYSGEASVWTVATAAIFAESFTAAYDRNYWSMLALTLVGSLNGLAGALVPIIYLFGAVEWSDMRQRFFLRNVWHLAMVGVGLAGSTLVAWGIRHARGWREPALGAAELFARNVEPERFLPAVAQFLLFGGAMWATAILGAKDAHLFFRREAWLVPLYLVPALVWGDWRNTLLFAPLYPLLVGFAIYRLRTFLREPERPNRVDP